MKFNPYIWRLYSESLRGQKMLNQAFPRFLKREAGGAGWAKTNAFLPVFEYTESGQHFEEVADFSLRRLLQLSLEDKVVDSSLKAEQAFLSWIEDGVAYTWKHEDKQDISWEVALGGEGGEAEIYDFIAPVTTVLHHRFPDGFFPYFFINQYKLLADICHEFEIPLPPLPGKLNKRARAKHYLEINSVLQAFRSQHELSPRELNAFLYDFAPNLLAGAEDGELPSPQRAWFLIAGVGSGEDFARLDEAGQQTRLRWRGHRDAQRGDIAIMWCASPRACLHSIWRIIEDGSDDPFSHWYSIVRLGRPTRVPALKIADLKKNPILASSPIVKGNLQGASGKYFRHEDYFALLKEIKRHGGSLDCLPRLAAPLTTQSIEISDERGVEQNFLEPLLERLGYTSKDWIRQYRLKMGRGDRVYPDYVIGLVGKPGQEQSKLLLEAKYRIATKKELLAAQQQGRSYGLRLQADWVVLASLEGIWLLDKKKDFAANTFQCISWSDLGNPETFGRLRAAIGKISLRR